MQSLIKGKVLIGIQNYIRFLTDHFFLTLEIMVTFVNGCFWHGHKCRYGKVKPSTNSVFWQTKREGNVARDKRNLRKLKKEGRKVLTIWECETRHQEKLTKKLKHF